MIPTTMQVVNLFQAKIMVPYLMLQKKSPIYWYKHIGKLLEQTKLGLQWDFYK